MVIGWRIESENSMEYRHVIDTFAKKLFLFDASIIRFLNKKITERTRYDETRGPTERKVNAQAVRNGV